MKEIVLSIDKEAVYEEVARTTSYAGAKMADEGAYDRIFTTDEDKLQLDRFWGECRSTVCNRLKRVLVSEGEANGSFFLFLCMSDSFDEVFAGSMQDSLFSFFVMGITAKWYVFTNKEEVGGYASEAATYLEDMMRKAFFKRKPVRPTYD